MGIQDRKIGRIPIYFGEYKDASTYYRMNRVTHYGSEFQLNIEKTTNGTTGYPPIVLKADRSGIDYENSNFTVNNTDPNKVWFIISNATASFDSSASIEGINEHIDASINEVNQRIDEIVEQYLKEVENPEFVEVHLDDEEKVLYGVQNDGNFYFGCGIPNQIQDALDRIPGINPNINGSIYYGTNPEATENPSRYVNNYISGVYQVSTTAGSHIYFFVPSSVTQFYASINGMEIPFNEEDVTIDGQTYKKYESTNTYDGDNTFNIVLA